MEVKKFEDFLKQMSKPEIHELKHMDMLSKAVTHAKEKTVLSLWWLSIPLYIVAALLMKTLFVPGSTLDSNMHEMEIKNKYSACFFFLVLPLVFCVIHFFTIRRIYFLSGNPRKIGFLKVVWYNVLMILIAVLIWFIYLL
jgi:hypothetical protein